MKLFATLAMTTMVCTILHAQLDSIANSRRFVFNKNQLCLVQDYAMVRENGSPWIGLEYRRLIKYNDSIEFAASGMHKGKFLLLSLHMSDFRPTNYYFNSHKILAVTDSFISQRSYGSNMAYNNLIIGRENQIRLVNKGKSGGGLQLSFAYFGTIGYSWNLNQYIYSKFYLDSVQSAVITNKNGSSYEIIGERVSHYVHLGLGAQFGLDWVMANSNSKMKVILGLKVSALNGSLGILVKSATIKDPDEVYLTPVRSTFFHMNPSIIIRAGLTF